MPPGQTVLTDPSGDQQGAPVANQGYDIQSVAIAEPEHQAGARLLAITLKVATLNPLPQSGYWWVHLKVNGADSFVGMRSPDPVSTDGTPIFEHGTVTNGNFTLSGGIEAGSNYKPDGTITFVVRNDAVGVPDGATVKVTAEAGDFISAPGQPLATNPDDDTSNSDQPTGGPYKLAGDGACGILPGGHAQVAPRGMAPRYQVYAASSGLGLSAGEPSVGYNFNTKRSMFIADLQTLRVDWPENLPDPLASPESPAMLPQACEATWTDVSFETTSHETLDPILHTEPVSGRTFVSQTTIGPGSQNLFAYSDDDGATWANASVAPPSGGVDHQTVGNGPYPSSLPPGVVPSWPAMGAPLATYYCSQDDVNAFCSRSDDGGMTFGPGFPIYQANPCGTASTTSIHGHVKISPDGAAYVTPKDCNGQQAITVTLDAGSTPAGATPKSWTLKVLPNTTADPEVDPAVGVASDNTVYDCFIDGGHHPHVQVSHDHGDHWSNDYDIGASVGVVNATFPAAVAGDPDRAACAFLGSTTPGNHDGLDFPGVWYPFVATTYDGGLSWHTVNVSPGDPVQGAGGICNAGTVTCMHTPNNRNLLDFNEVALDERGYLLFGYADGCRTPLCISDPIKHNDFADKATIARQRGGRPLLAKFDPVEPVAPQPACLAGVRYKSSGAHLKWRVPDSGGADISGYHVFRATSAQGPYTQVGSVAAVGRFDDPKGDPGVANYYYKIAAVNSKGASGSSNLVKLAVLPDPPVETSCKLPGITVVTDPSGDAVPNQPSLDIQSIALAEPADMPGKLEFTMKVGDLSTVPPGTRWAIRFLTDTQPANGDDNYFVEMTTVPADFTAAQGAATPQFVYGTTGAPSEQGNSVPARIFNVQGDLDPASNMGADGTIKLVLDETKVPSLTVGLYVTGLFGSTRAAATPNNEAIYDQTDTGTYQLRGTDYCRSTPPAPQSGNGAPQSGNGAPQSGNGAPPVYQSGNGLLMGRVGSLGLLTLLPLFSAGLLRRRYRRARAAVSRISEGVGESLSHPDPGCGARSRPHPRDFVRRSSAELLANGSAIPASSERGGDCW